MKIPEVDVRDWKELYDAAAEFRDLKPWELMSSGDLFAVKNPEDGEIAYCCIMGELGEVFSLTAYLGSDGIRGYLEIVNDTNGVNPEAMHIQNCLMASFEDRDSLDKQDLKVIKEIGYKFRGKKQWPVFRAFEPGYFPWFLNPKEVRFLTLLLRQAIEVLRIAEKDPDYLIVEEDRCTARIPEMREGKIEWKNSIVDFKAQEKEINVPSFGNEIKLRNIKKNIKVKPDVFWALDWFYAPVPVGEGDKPFYPSVIFIVGGDMGEVINFELVQKENLYEKLQVKLIETIEQQKLVPKGILVENEKVYLVLREIGELLGIDIRISEGDELFENVKYGMYDYFFHM